MAVAAKPAVPIGRGEAASLDLTHETRPAVVIDPDAAAILTANASGGAALGLFSYAAFPIALDPAMPAIARLRQIASGGNIGKGEFETLLFWSSGRLKRVKCKITRYGGKGSKVLLLYIDTVEAPEDAVPTGQRRSSAPPPRVMGQGDEMGGNAGASKLSVALDADFLAKLAHELKTPLTAIAAAAEVMRDQRLGEMKNERYLSYAADIHESATHALDVISSLLADRAKPAGPVSRLIAIDLNAIAERTVSSVQALAESCGLQLSFETDGRKRHVVANPTALRQVLLNLLTNAIKFTPRGGNISVGTGNMDDGRAFLVVHDTGCGMNGSVAPVDGPASAADRKSEWARSHGIGLPLVEMLVRDMGAEIQIDSTPQKGTAATILFSDFSQRFK